VCCQGSYLTGYHKVMMNRESETHNEVNESRAIRTSHEKLMITLAVDSSWIYSSLYSIGPVLATPLVLATNPLYSLKT
jgi:hypothetical protein